VHLELDSRPGSVALVRAVLAGASELLEFEAELLADLKTAVSEACNNVVMHAYAGDPGPLIVHLVAAGDAVEVTVRDCGSGINESGSAEEQEGLGIAVISALAAKTEVLSSPAVGTEVRMLFGYQAGTPDLHRMVSEVDPGSGEPVPGDVVVSVAPVSLLPGILGRVAGCVAAEAHFSIDSYADLYTITDGIAAHATNYASDDTISVGLAARPRQIEVTVGPFQAGTASHLRAAAPNGPPLLLALLVDHIVARSLNGSEALHVMLVDSESGAAINN
jgi:anti-sigma regulatory factor (Ser/Thr protein kinase)